MMDVKGQTQIIGQAIGIIVIFVALSLGMALVDNFQGNTEANPANAVPFNDIWPLAVAGIAILSLIIGLMTMFGGRR